MGLYLCVFDNEEELDGIEVGAYDDFDDFRDTVRDLLEGDKTGSKFPVLMLHSDCDGVWSADEARFLEKELTSISEAFKKTPSRGFRAEWQKDVAKSLGLHPENLFECFIDIDGEPLLERLINLCRLAININKPILFQ